jgi:hypothetical protein
VAQQNDKTTVFFMLTVMAFAIVLVDDRWVRVGLGLLPALLLAEWALMGSGVGEEPRIGAADRRDDGAVRGYIDDLLKHFREFYTTCHLMAGGQLEPEEAKDLAAGIERRLNALLAEITDAARERDSA